MRCQNYYADRRASDSTLKDNNIFGELQLKKEAGNFDFCHTENIMNKDMSKYGKKLNPLKYYLLIYIAIVLLVAFIDIEILDGKDSEHGIGEIRVALFFLSISVLPFLAIFNCLIRKCNFWLTLLEFSMCFAVLVGMGGGLIGFHPMALLSTHSFGEFCERALSALRYYWAYSIPIIIILSILVWLVNRKISKKNGPSDAME